MKNLPLYSALTRQQKLNRISFHTPGHKNNSQFQAIKFFNLDYTELPETDSLYEAQTVIKRSEKLMSKLFKSKQTIFSAGGCTLCIQTMLKLALPYGGKIIASRMIHKSAVNTMAILNAKVKWIMPKINKNSGEIEQVEAVEIEKALFYNRDASCVYITSPDYFGKIADIKSIAKVCKEYNVPLLVDNAHGTHLKFLFKDIHPITLGADIVADSAHKTLPVLTGGALLHIANEKYISKAKDSMSIFGSTSPSYPIMASLDVCRGWLNKNGRAAYSKLEKNFLKIKAVASKKGLLDNYENTDPIRLSLNTAKVGVLGIEAAEYFRKNGVEPEFADRERVVFIATPMNSNADLTKLENLIISFPSAKAIPNYIPIFEEPIVAKTLHKALFSQSEKISSVNSLGRISAGTICPCPPGIPILVPGEVITENSIQNLLHYGILFLDVIK